MRFEVVISTIASIVAIVGGVLGIISSLSKEPVFLRFWKRQASRQAPAVLQPSPVLSKPVEEAAPSPVVQEQTHQILPVNRFKLGIVYGLVLGVLSILIVIGIAVLGFSDIIFTVSVLIGLGVLSIVAGLFPSRASGSLLSGGIAGGILGLFSFLTFDIVSETRTLLGFAIFGVLPFTVSLLFGLLGRNLHKKFQTIR
jgi:hypothetical protein